MRSASIFSVLFCVLLSLELGSIAAYKRQKYGNNKKHIYSLKGGQNSLDSSAESGLKEFSYDCKIPKFLENSELNCVKYESVIKCTQYCVFGYTFSDGVQRKMLCVKEAGQWTPYRKIEDCKPFIDCNVKISEGGKYKCSSHSVDKAPTCKISCQKFEDKEAVQMKEHKCTIEGQWDPPLPHCARSGSGLSLVPAPKKKKTVTREKRETSIKKREFLMGLGY